MKFKWELVEDSAQSNSSLPYFQETERAKVIGGWIVKTLVSYDSYDSLNDHNSPDWDRRLLSTIFIPDPNHKWELEDDLT